MKKMNGTSKAALVALPFLIAFLLAAGAFQVRVASLEDQMEEHRDHKDKFIGRAEFEQYEKRMTEQHEAIKKMLMDLKRELRRRRK